MCLKINNELKSVRVSSQPSTHIAVFGILAFGGCGCSDNSPLKVAKTKSKTSIACLHRRGPQRSRFFLHGGLYFLLTFCYKSNSWVIGVRSVLIFFFFSLELLIKGVSIQMQAGWRSQRRGLTGKGEKGWAALWVQEIEASSRDF